MTYPLAQGHGGDPERLSVIRPAADNTVYWPSGLEFTTASDLARFAVAFMNNGKIEGKQVLSQAMIAKLSTPYVAMHSSPSSCSIENGNYGYGAMIHSYRGVRIIEHGGVIPGYGCRLMMAPERRFAVIFALASSRKIASSILSLFWYPGRTVKCYIGAGDCALGKGRRRISS